jgi:hypothetical protein
MNDDYCPCLICEELTAESLAQLPEVCVPIREFAKSESVVSVATTEASSDYSFASGLEVSSSSLKVKRRTVKDEPTFGSSCSSEMEPNESFQSSVERIEPIESPEQGADMNTRSKGNRRRMQRRCSVTKFSLDDAITVAKQTEERKDDEFQNGSRGRNSRLRARVTKINMDGTIHEVKLADGGVDEGGTGENVPERPRVNRRMQRRSSVTQFNLEVCMKQVQLQDEPETQDVKVVRPKSFRARLPWGRAA